MEIPNFSDLVEDTSLSGDKLRIDDILGRKLIVTGYNISPSKYNSKGIKDCIKVQFYFEEDGQQTKYIIFTGSQVIKTQLEQISTKLKNDNSEFLFRATINKIGNYYSFE